MLKKQDEKRLLRDIIEGTISESGIEYGFTSI
jgi:hypothetical protein